MGNLENGLGTASIILSPELEAERMGESVLPQGPAGRPHSLVKSAQDAAEPLDQCSPSAPDNEAMRLTVSTHAHHESITDLLYYRCRRSDLSADTMIE